MAWYDPAGRVPEWRIPAFPEYSSAEWTPFGQGSRWVIRIHVQELGENGVDNAHFPFLHSQQTTRLRTDALDVDGPRLVHRTFHDHNLFGLAKLFVSEVSGPLDSTLDVSVAPSTGPSSMPNHTLVRVSFLFHTSG